MDFVIFLSNLMIPLVIFYIVGYGFLSKTDLFGSFTKGAMDGMKVVAGILPTLIGLMLGIALLRESGTLDLLAKLFAPWTEMFGFPAELVPLTLVKMFSSSAANGLLVDIYKQFGTDTREGFLASILMCCSETIFYTISVYFMATGDKEHVAVTKVSWTIVGALFCTMAGIIASVVITNFMF